MCPAFHFLNVSADMYRFMRTVWFVEALKMLHVEAVT